MRLSSLCTQRCGVWRVRAAVDLPFLPVLGVASELFTLGSALLYYCQSHNHMLLLHDTYVLKDNRVEPPPQLRLAWPWTTLD